MGKIKTTFRKYFNRCFSRILFICIIFLSSSNLLLAGTPPPKDSIEVYKIWDKAKHNGFPDLFRFKSHFYCTFREATGHVNNDNKGKVRIIRSKDGKNWENVTLFEMEGVDVREARLSVTPEGEMLAIIAAGVWKDGYQWLSPFVSFSDKAGLNFSSMEKPFIDPSIKPSLDWIWRVTWNNGIGYSIMYQVDYAKDTPWKAQLLRTKDGKNYEKITQLQIEGRPSESTIRFDRNGKMYILVRNDGADQMGVMCKSEFPYKDWIYNKMKIKLGGPNFLFLNDSQFVMGTRFWENKKALTALLVTDLNGNIQKTFKLPSGGDTSYPGMVIHKNKLWFAYYSSHEGKSNIYMAVIPLKQLTLM